MIYYLLFVTRKPRIVNNTRDIHMSKKKSNYETPPAEKHNNCCETACLVFRPSYAVAAVRDRPMHRTAPALQTLLLYGRLRHSIPRVEITVLLRYLYVFIRW